MSRPARPASSLETRCAELADVRELAELAARTFTDAFAAQNDPDDIAAYVAEAFSVEQIERELRAPGSDFLIGFDPTLESPEPVGYCRLVGGSREERIEGPEPAELQRLYVEGTRRNAGYGSALMWDCLELGRERGYRTIWLGVWEENRGAQRFYERWGFAAVGTHEFVLGRDRQRDLLMALALDED